MNAFHSANSFLFSRHHILTYSIAPFSAYKYTHNPQFLQFLWWRAIALEMSAFKLYTVANLLTQLIILNYPFTCTAGCHCFCIWGPVLPIFCLSDNWQQTGWVLAGFFFMLQSGELAITLFINTNLIRLWVCFLISKYSSQNSTIANT